MLYDKTFSPYNNIKCRASHGIIEQNDIGKANSIAIYEPNLVKCYIVVFLERHITQKTVS